MKMAAIRHPKMNRLMRILGISRPLAVGTMEMLWHWAGDYAIDGELTEVMDEIEVALDWDGEPGSLVRAMIESGFIDENDGRFFIHDWADHYPDYVKKRLDRIKKRDAADNGGQRQKMADNGGQRPPTKTRQDKSRQDKTGPDTSAAGAANKSRKKKKPEDEAIPENLDTDEFRDAWADWLADRRERGKPLTARAARMHLNELSTLENTNAAIECIELAINRGWQGIKADWYRNAKGSGLADNRQRDADGHRIGRIEAKPGKYDHLPGGRRKQA